MKLPGNPPSRLPDSESFGLIAIIESRRVVLPLKGVECDFAVLGGIAEVAMTQIFRQENPKPLDCEYLFPLPADAAVYFCEADINGRTIRAKVHEREKARELAASKKAEGYRTALVESERENLFTLSLGNLQPDDLVIIRLKYVQALRSLAGEPSIEIPFCPGMRYIPGNPLLRSNKGRGVADDTDQVPDASRITPVRIDPEHPDAAYVEVRGTLEGRFVESDKVFSPSHSIDAESDGEHLRISLSSKGEVPDRDFVLRWKEKTAESVTSRAWACEKSDGTYALLEIRAPRVSDSQQVPADLYFLVDRSGSMQGLKWNKAVEALLSCVGVLGDSDRVMVTFFESGFQDYSEGPTPVKELAKDRRFQGIAKLGTAGGTELAPALEHVLEVAERSSAGRCKNLILITDAQVGNEDRILEVMTRAPGFPVHCFGMDYRVNDALLLALCHQQGGTFHSIHPRDDVRKAVRTLGKTLGRPALLDLALPAGWETADASIPHLYSGQIHYLAARSTTKALTIELRGRSAAGEAVNRSFEVKPVSNEAPFLHWCRTRTERLLAEGETDAAIELSIRSNLVCRATAFVAWDESEKVPVASHQLTQSNQFAHTELFDVLDQTWCASGGREVFLSKLPVRSALLGSAFAKRRIGFANEPKALKLRLEMSELCRQLGVGEWDSLVQAVFDWIEAAKRTEREKRLEIVQRLLEELRTHANPGAQALAAAGEDVKRRLKEFVLQLPGAVRRSWLRERLAAMKRRLAGRDQELQESHKSSTK